MHICVCSVTLCVFSYMVEKVEDLCENDGTLSGIDQIVIEGSCLEIIMMLNRHISNSA